MDAVTSRVDLSALAPRASSCLPMELTALVSIVDCKITYMYNTPLD